MRQKLIRLFILICALTFTNLFAVPIANAGNQQGNRYFGFIAVAAAILHILSMSRQEKASALGNFVKSTLGTKKNIRMPVA